MHTAMRALLLVRVRAGRIVASLNGTQFRRQSLRPHRDCGNKELGHHGQRKHHGAPGAPLVAAETVIHHEPTIAATEPQEHAPECPCARCLSNKTAAAALIQIKIGD